MRIHAAIGGGAGFGGRGQAGAPGDAGLRQRPTDLLPQGHALLEQLFVALLHRPHPFPEFALEHLRQILQQGLVAVPFAPGRLQLLREHLVAEAVGVGRVGHRRKAC